MGTTKHPRKIRLHRRARNCSSMSISVTGQSFCCSRVSLDGYCQALCPWFPTAFSHQGWKGTVLQLVPIMPGCEMPFGTAARLKQFLVFLSSPQMTHGINMAAMHPKLLSEGVHGHFRQGLTCTSCGQQGSSLGTVNQIDQKIPDSSEADTQHSRFHLDHRQPMEWCSVNSPCYWSKLSQDEICLIGK